MYLIEGDIAACVCCANDAFGFNDLPPEGTYLIISLLINNYEVI